MGILIKNGHILNPPTGTDEVMDLYVEGDRVIKMQKDLAAGAVLVAGVASLACAIIILIRHIS